MNFIFNGRALSSSLVTALVTTITSSSAALDIWTVGPDPLLYDFTDLQTAIDQVSSSDILDVAEGTYTGTGDSVIDFKGKSLTIRAIGQSSKTIIDGENARQCVRCENVADGGMRGFTLRNGKTTGLSSYRGGGLNVTASDMGFAYCIFTNNESYTGGGVSMKDSSVFFSGCTFRNNNATTSGGALYATQSEVNLFSSTVRDNTASFGGGAFMASGVFQVHDTLFCQNTPTHVFLLPDAIAVDFGKNQYNDACPEFAELLGMDFVAELAFYVPIPPCDPLDELAANVMPVDNPEEFFDPTAIAVTPLGDLAIVDSALGLIHSYGVDANAYQGTLFQSDMMQQPVAIAFDAGLGYVADAAGLVHIFDASNGSSVGVLLGDMLAPVDLAFDTDGILWTSNANGAAPVQAWDPGSGEMLFAFSGEFPGFEMPGAITVLPDGQLLVVDQADSEIYSFDRITGTATPFLSAQDAEELGLGEITMLECASDTRVYVQSARGLSRFTQGGWFMGDLTDADGLLASETLLATFKPEPDPHPWNPADFNRDSLVNGADLAQLLGAWGTEVPEFDLTDDGIVGGADLAVLLGSWS